MAAWNPRANDIFLDALEIAAPPARRTFLDQACGDDDALRAAVEALLHAQAAAGSLLEDPVAADLTLEQAAPPLANREMEKPGTRIGPYKLLEKIGEGGMGTVWMAEQSEPVRRLVALKLIKAGLDSGQISARFDAERQALAMMDHPNIAKVLEAGNTSDEAGAGRPFFVMELVKGVPITTYCDERRLSPRARLALFIPVCQAVQHAHQKGIIHRDLKPSNVLIALYDGTPVPKVIDFGIAKATQQKLTERTLFTGFGALVGTLEYMSPEQAELNQLDIDTRSDIYSLGVLLYELLTGSTPLDRKRLKADAILELLRLIREDDPPRPSTRLSTSEALATLSEQRGMAPASLSKLLRGELDWIIMKALEKDRNRRYDTANSLAADIHRYLADEPVQAGPPSTSYRLRKFVKRNRGAVLAAAVVTLALVGGMVGTTWGLLEARQQRAAAEDAKDQANDNARAARFQALRSDIAGHTLQLELALRAWEQHNIVRAEQILAKVGRPFQKTWETRFLQALCRRKAWPLLGHANPISSVAISADGARLVSASDSTIIVWNAYGQEQHTLRGHTGAVHSVAISVDGARIVSGGEDRTVKVWDAHSGQEERRLWGHAGPVYSVAITADGGLVVSGSEDGTARIWDARTGREKFSLKGHKEAVWSVAVNAEGTLVASGSQDKTVKLWDGQTGQERFSLPEETDPVFSVALSADGQRLAFASWETVKVLDATTAKERHSLKGHTQTVTSVALSADGARLISASHDLTVKVWNAATGVEMLSLQGHSAGVQSVAISNTGKHVVSGSRDRTVRLWDTSPHQYGLSLTGHTGFVMGVAISRDGTRIVSGSADKTIKVWDARTGLEKLSLEGHTGTVYSVGISADGGRIVSGSADETVRVWDGQTGRQQLCLTGHTNLVQEVAFSADGGRIVSCGPDGTVKVWDAQTGKTLLSLDGHMGSINSVAISADGARILAGGERTAKVWDAQSGRLLLALTGHTGSVVSVALSADGTRLVSASDDQTVRVWDGQTGQQLHVLKGETGMNCVAISADGARVASGCVAANRETTLQVWETVTGQEKLSLKGHTDSVRTVAFSADGARLVSGSNDRTIKVWDAP